MTNKTLTLGSLFDGSGGFPLGGLLAGITPVWASEIEPFPIRVTTKRLPFMKHYGNISAMDGGRIEPVDIITFGSPCQDMSVAGRRDGLDGSRSSLFYEAVRIIKEMRCATDGKYPRWICWENVPGAFSSNKGEDFKAVLEAVIGIAEPNAQVPMPEKERWPYADLYLGDGWSVAYRTLDAQYWGVPQRRRRIYLVADLAGGSAGKILFESEGLSGYSAEGFRSWQRATGSFTPCAGATGFDGYNGNLTDDTSATLGVNCGMSTGRNGIVLNDQGGNRMDITEDVTSTLRAEAHHPPCVMESAGFCTEHLHYCYKLGYLPNYKKLNANRVHYLLREDLYKLDQLSAQVRLLGRENISTTEQLFLYKSKAMEQIKTLTAHRTHLRNEIRKVNIDDESLSTAKLKIEAITEALSELRKDVRLCDAIAERSGVMQENLEKALAEEEKIKRKENRSYEQRR